MDVTQNNDVFVEVSGLLKALAVNLLKISKDLRLMNSGPYGGLGEIRLKAVQQGSTIMLILAKTSASASELREAAVPLSNAKWNFLNAFPVALGTLRDSGRAHSTNIV